MTTDVFADFKAKQREGWAHFAPVEVHTTRPATHLVRTAGIREGQNVLDVGCGTGVAAITARRAGASVTGLDLTPELLARARENAAIAGFDDITWKEGDVEDLPFRDGEFDVVISQWGHMFAPQPEVALREMLRVLKPKGTIAFTTWPPESSIGQMFGLIGKYMPPPPGVAPPFQWGEVETVRQRLGSAVKDVRFYRGIVEFTALSPQHYRYDMSRTSAPYIALRESLRSDPSKLAQLEDQIDRVFADYFHDNAVRLEYLQTRATKI
jgi:ubiquinone/menaquinone biosynthesis C-methylase UbiE